MMTFVPPLHFHPKIREKIRQRHCIDSRIVVDCIEHIPLAEVDIGLLADEVGVAATDTLDLGQSVHDLLLSINVGVEETQDVLEVRLLAGHERCIRKGDMLARSFLLGGLSCDPQKSSNGVFWCVECVAGSRSLRGIERTHNGRWARGLAIIVDRGMERSRVSKVSSDFAVRCGIG